MDYQDSISSVHQKNAKKYKIAKSIPKSIERYSHFHTPYRSQGGLTVGLFTAANSFLHSYSQVGLVGSIII